MTRNMAATAARKSITESKQQLGEGDYTIIPNDIMVRMLDNNDRLQEHLIAGHQQLVETQQSTNEALTKIATALETCNATSIHFHTNLLAKMDDLVSKISSNNLTINNATTPVVITDEELKSLAQKKCHKEQQIRCATELAEWYTELLTKTPP